MDFDFAGRQAQILDVGRVVADAQPTAVSMATMQTRSGPLGLLRSSRSVLVVLTPDTMRLQPIVPESLELDGEAIELTTQNIVGLGTRPNHVTVRGNRKQTLYAGTEVRVKTDAGGDYVLSLVDGTGNLFRDHPEAISAEIKGHYEVIVAWLGTAGPS
ncbi:MAG: hypothetical protein ACRDKE_04565 [Solirubrobacterales bacterium]